MPNYIPPALVPGNATTYLNPVLTVTNEAATMAAGENPMAWYFETFVLGVPMAAQLNIQVTATPAEGEAFNLSPFFNEGFPIIETIGSNSPSFGQYDTSGSLSAIANSIANVLNNDIVFNRLFYADSITAAGFIIITAINTGSRYTLVFTGGSAFTQALNTAGTDADIGQSNKDFQVFCEVFVNGSGEFGDLVDKQTMQRITTITKNYQPDNIIKFDVSGVVKNYLNTEQPNTAPQAKYNNHTINYCLLFGYNSKDSNNITQKVITGVTAVKWVQLAALGLLETNDLTDYVCTVGTPNKLFLTEQPVNKDWWIGQKDYVNFLWQHIPALPNIAILYIRPYFYDGTIGAFQQVSILFPTGGQYAIDLNALPISSIESTAGKLIKLFDLRLSGSISLTPGSATPITRLYKYTIRRECPERTLDIVFLNPLGGWDGLRMTERKDINTTRKAETFEKTRPYLPTSSDTIRGVKSVKVERSESWATGWLPLSHRNWLDSFLQSPAIYIYLGGVFTLILIDNERLEFDDEADKFNLSFTFETTDPLNSISQ